MKFGLDGNKASDVTYSTFGDDCFFFGHHVFDVLWGQINTKNSTEFIGGGGIGILTSGQASTTIQRLGCFSISEWLNIFPSITLSSCRSNATLVMIHHIR